MEEILAEIEILEKEIAKLFKELSTASPEFHEDIEDDIRKCIAEIAELEEEMENIKESASDMAFQEWEYSACV